MFAVLCLSSLCILRIQEDHLRSGLKGRVEVLSDSIRVSLLWHMLEERAGEFQDFLNSQISGDVEEVRIFSTEGKILASSIPTEIGSPIYMGDLERFNQHSKKHSKPRAFSHHKEGQELYSVVAPVYNDWRCHRCHDPSIRVLGVLDTEIAVDANLAAPLRELRLYTAVSLILAVLAIMAAIWVLTGHLVKRPIDELADTMRRVRDGDLSTRYRTTRIDEIGRLARSLNLMLASVEGASKEIERRHEERLHRVERLATVGELATSIAHEIKNPLAGISGAMQVIGSDLKEDDPRREIIDEIHGQVARLDRSVRDLHNFAKPPDPNFIIVDVNTVLKGAVSIINRVVDSATVDLALEEGEDIGEAELDPDMIQEAVFNIVSYCMKAAGNCGRILISGRRPDSGEVEISILASNCRLLPAAGEDVFRPTFSTGEKADGLALAICKDIIAKHNGMISIDVALDEGMIFSIRLPDSQKGYHG